MSRRSLASLLVATAGCALGAGSTGCGTVASSTVVHSAAPRSVHPAAPLRRRIPDVQYAPAGLLQRHDVPPRGVRSQIAFFQQGGPPGCWTQVPASFTIAFGRGMLRTAAHYRDADALHPEQGEAFAVCVGVADTAPVAVTMRGPDGSVRRTTLPGGNGSWTETDWYTGFADRALLGRYVVEARQGPLHATRTVTLGRPSVPEYHVVVHMPSRTVMDIVVLGLYPGERARLAFYRAGGYSGHGKPRAGYVTSVSVNAADDGIAVYRFRFLGPTPRRCDFYVAKAEVRGRWLDDLDNTISAFTPPCIGA